MGTCLHSLPLRRCSFCIRDSRRIETETCSCRTLTCFIYKVFPLPFLLSAPRRERCVACGKGEGGRSPISVSYILPLLSSCVSSPLSVSFCLSPPHSCPVLSWPGALVSVLVTGASTASCLLPPAAPVAEGGAQGVQGWRTPAD